MFHNSIRIEIDKSRMRSIVATTIEHLNTKDAEKK